MYRKILIALDGSDGSRKALAAAVGLAGTFGAELHAIAVGGHLVADNEIIDEVDEQKAEIDAYFAGVCHEAVRYAADHGVALRAVMVMGDAGREVVRHAGEGQFDLLVVGASPAHHRLRIGSTEARVVDHSPCSVMVVK